MLFMFCLPNYIPSFSLRQGSHYIAQVGVAPSAEQAGLELASFFLSLLNGCVYRPMVSCLLSRVESFY